MDHFDLRIHRLRPSQGNLERDRAAQIVVRDHSRCRLPRFFLAIRSRAANHSHTNIFDANFRLSLQLGVGVLTHGRVAFLPFAPIMLKALKPKEPDFEPQTMGTHITKKRLETGTYSERSGPAPWSRSSAPSTGNIAGASPHLSTFLLYGDSRTMGPYRQRPTAWPSTLPRSDGSLAGRKRRPPERSA